MEKSENTQNNLIIRLFSVTCTLKQVRDSLIVSIKPTLVPTRAKSRAQPVQLVVLQILYLILIQNLLIKQYNLRLSFISRVHVLWEIKPMLVSRNSGFMQRIHDRREQINLLDLANKVNCSSSSSVFYPQNRNALAARRGVQ